MPRSIATATLDWNLSFTREVLGAFGRFFPSAADFATLLESAEATDAQAGADAQAPVEDGQYDWDEVAKAYEEACDRPAAGWSVRGQPSGRRGR